MKAGFRKDGTALSMDEYPAFEVVFPLTFIDSLVKTCPQFRVRRDDLHRALQLAQKSFIWESFNRACSAEVASTASSVRLYKAMTKALQELIEPGMMMRLQRAHEDLLLAGIVDPPTSETHWWATIEAMHQFLPIIKKAMDVDGRIERIAHYHTRSDISGAVVPLLDFWCACGEKGTVYDWRDTSPALKFLIRCIERLDPLVKTSSIIAACKTYKSQ